MSVEESLGFCVVARKGRGEAGHKRLGEGHLGSAAVILVLVLGLGSLFVVAARVTPCLALVAGALAIFLRALHALMESIICGHILMP